MLHRMQQSIPKGICIAAPPNKLHQCSIDELTIEVLTADVHLHTVPCTFDGVSMDSGYWVHEVLCMVHGLVLHSEVIQGTIPSPERSSQN